MMTGSVQMAVAAVNILVSVSKVKVSCYAMQVPGGERYSSYSFLTSALDGGEWSASCPGQFYFIQIVFS
jgi:hypothetical protein